MQTIFQPIIDQTRPRHSYQRIMYRTGVALMAVGVAHIAGLAFDPSGWWGTVSWRKPMNFGLSFGLTLLTFGWILGHTRRRPTFGPLVAWAVSIASALEVAAVSIQRWRGVPSHFNTATKFDNAVFSLMGLSVVVIAIVTVVLLVWAVRDLRGEPVVWIASVSGLILVLVASGVGSDLIARGNETVASTGQVPDSLTVGAAGSAKLAHFVGLHGIQVFSALTVLLGVGTLPEKTKRRLMLTAVLGWVAIYGVVLRQAYTGLSFWAMDVASVAVTMVGIGLLTIVWRPALRGVGPRLRSVESVRNG